MDLIDIQNAFNRAWIHSFSIKKLITVFIVLLLCGLLVIFFRGLAIHTGDWIALSLTFLPLFLCSGVLLSLGVVLIRFYHDEIKKREISLRKIVGKSLEVIAGTAYLSVPIILIYLMLWMFLGIFFLLSDTPGIGGFFSVILSFAPFLLNLGALLLSVLSLSLLFFVTPIIALKGINHMQLTMILTSRFQRNLFISLCLAIVSVFPLILLSGILLLAAVMTGSVCYVCEEPMYLILQWFFIMIPFTAILSPAVVFFFNFSAEAHLLLQRLK